MNNIWIINHHAGYYGGRHYYMGGYLARKGYNVRIFRASTRHITGKSIRKFEGKFVEQEHNDIKYVYIKAREYGRSGMKRIFNMLDFTKNVISLGRKKRFERPDIIIASSVHPLAWFAGSVLARYYKVPIVLETRDLWPETFVTMGKMKRNGLPAKVLYAYEKHFYEKADALIFTTSGHQEYLKSRKIERETYYVNNGVDLDTYKQHLNTHPFIDKDYSGASGFRVVYTGAIGRANHCIDILTCAEELKNRNIRNIKFYLFGDGKEKADLEAYAIRNDLDNVIFMGQVDKEYIPSILDQGDLNIFTGLSIPLYTYGLSLNKVFEYLASGKPTISNMECGYDVLKEFGAGETVSDSTAEKMADRILHYKNLTEEEYNIISRKAEAAAEIFDYKALADTYEKLLQETYETYFKEKLKAK